MGSSLGKDPKNWSPSPGGEEAGLEEFESVKPGEDIPEAVDIGAVAVGMDGRTATLASRAEALSCVGDLQRSRSSCCTSEISVDTDGGVTDGGVTGALRIFVFESGSVRTIVAAADWNSVCAEVLSV